MAVAIRTLRRRRRTTQRGKPMTQSQRWGKVVTTMPVPEGVITTSALWEEPTQPVSVTQELTQESILEEETEDESN